MYTSSQRHACRAPRSFCKASCLPRYQVWLIVIARIGSQHFDSRRNAKYETYEKCGEISPILPRTLTRSGSPDTEGEMTNRDNAIFFPGLSPREKRWAGGGGRRHRESNCSLLLLPSRCQPEATYLPPSCKSSAIGHGSARPAYSSLQSTELLACVRLPPDFDNLVITRGFLPSFSLNGRRKEVSKQNNKHSSR